MLSEMRSKSLGISINGLSLGAFAHADDLRTMASNIEDTSKQALFVNSFTTSRVFHLCLEKCALLSPSNNPLTSSLKIDDVTSLPVEKSVNCLGVWWDNSASSHACIKERIQKARAAFFFQWSIRCLSRPPKPPVISQHCWELHTPCFAVRIWELGAELFSIACTWIFPSRTRTACTETS